MLLLGFSERDLKPKRGLPLRSPAWDLALGAGPARPEAPPPPPRVHPALEAAKPLSPKPSLSPPPPPARALLPTPQIRSPASTFPCGHPFG